MYSNFCCSICGQHKNEKNKLIICPNNIILCERCLYLCCSSLGYNITPPNQKTTENVEKDLIIPKPKKIKDFLDQYIISQEIAKTVVSVASYNHYKRINHNKDPKNIEVKKSNILLIGPTGSGKTLIAETISKILDVPFVIGDATTMTSAGYVGEDVESLLTRLLQSTDYDVKKAEKGIVYIDEIDKLAKRSSGNTKDVGGEGVQQALLKLLDGSICNVPLKKNKSMPYPETVQMNTKNILFICGGAFDGLNEIVKNRKEKKNSIGFSICNNDNKENIEYMNSEIIDDIHSEDLTSFGLIPELIGRLPVICGLNKLTKEDLKRILLEPNDSIIKQYKALLQYDGVELEFNNECIDKIIEESEKKNIGARGLRSVIEKKLLKIMYEVPENENIHKCVVTVDEPEYLFKEELIKRVN